MVGLFSLFNFFFFWLKLIILYCVFIKFCWNSFCFCFVYNGHYIVALSLARTLRCRLFSIRKYTFCQMREREKRRAPSDLQLMVKTRLSLSLSEITSLFWSLFFYRGLVRATNKLEGCGGRVNQSIYIGKKKNKIKIKMYSGKKIGRKTGKATQVQFKGFHCVSRFIARVS